MISDFKELNALFEEIDKALDKKVHFFIIGGAMLLYHGIKPATKDIDIIVETKNEFLTAETMLKKIKFTEKTLSFEYRKMDLNQIFVREDFRIDLFQRTVCDGFALSDNMIKRAEKIIELDNITVSLCSTEDVFLFKTLTEREGDLEDCIALAQRGIDWKIILHELKHQIKTLEKPVWVTWVGERLDILEEKGLDIPIMNEVNKLRLEYFNYLESKYK